MRYFPQELLIMRLKNKLPRHPSLKWVREMSVEEALHELKKLAGQDMGTNPEDWAKWWRAERRRLDIDPDF